MNDILEKLRKPFHPSAVSWLPGSVKDGKALAMAYANPRVYMERLDEVCGVDWGVTFSPWGDKIVCHLTIEGMTRSSTGEPDEASEKREIEGTVAEAQAFKRAAAMWGLGRYFYSFPAQWVAMDGNKISGAGLDKLNKILFDHYKREMGKAPVVVDVDMNEVPSMSDGDDQAAVWAAIPGAVLKSVTPAPVVAQTTALAPLTSEKLQQFVTGCAAKQAKAPKPCSDKQYPLLVRVIDEIGGKGSHNAVLSYLCDKEEVNSDNRPGWELTSFLINHLMKDARGEDGKYGPNPNYKPEYTQAISQVAGMVREMA